MIDRGQTLLVGAIALAVLFVSLALVLNTAIYGSTIASQGSEDVTGGQTIALQSAVERDVGYLVRDAHDETDPESYIHDNIGVLSEWYTEYYAHHDRIVSISPQSDAAATVIQGTNASKSGSDFTNGTGSGNTANYDIVKDARVRNFEIDVTGFSGSNVFTMTFDNGSESYDVEIDGGAGEIRLIHDGTEQADCGIGGTPSINVTRATVNGDYCNALDFFERLDGSYSLRFENSNDIEGSFQFVKSETTTGLGGGLESEWPYGANVDVIERSTRVDYENTIRVAPGEPR